MPITPTYPEKELLLRIAEGDEYAFTALFDRYWEPIYAVAMNLVKSKDLARDMLQEIFLKVWTIRQELPHKENFKNFLFILSRNFIYNELRRKTQEESFNEHIIQHFSEKSANALELLLHKESAALVNQAIQQLPEQQRMVYQLTRELGLSQDEVAQELQIAKTTVKTHMSRALASIRRYIIQHADSNFVLLFLFRTLF